MEFGGSFLTRALLSGMLAIDQTMPERIRIGAENVLAARDDELAGELDFLARNLEVALTAYPLSGASLLAFTAVDSLTRAAYARVLPVLRRALGSDADPHCPPAARSAAASAYAMLLRSPFVRRSAGQDMLEGLCAEYTRQVRVARQCVEPPGADDSGDGGGGSGGGDGEGDDVFGQPARSAAEARVEDAERMAEGISLFIRDFCQADRMALGTLLRSPPPDTAARRHLLGTGMDAVRELVAETCTAVAWYRRIAKDQSMDPEVRAACVEFARTLEVGLDRVLFALRAADHPDVRERAAAIVAAATVRVPPQNFAECLYALSDAPALAPPRPDIADAAADAVAAERRHVLAHTQRLAQEGTVASLHQLARSEDPGRAYDAAMARFFLGWHPLLQRGFARAFAKSASVISSVNGSAESTFAVSTADCVAAFVWPAAFGAVARSRRVVFLCFPAFLGSVAIRSSTDMWAEGPHVVFWSGLLAYMAVFSTTAPVDFFKLLAVGTGYTLWFSNTAPTLHKAGSAVFASILQDDAVPIAEKRRLAKSDAP